MSRFDNKRKDSFLAKLPVKSLDDDDDNLSSRCKFNFSYFDVQPAGQDFSDWPHADLAELFGKLREYTKQPLEYWAKQPVGKKSGTVLAIYDGFPKKSEFTHPKHVPHQVKWARFRLKFSVRLVGFVLPPDLDGKPHAKTGHAFDKNTFYVVFLDANHKFWVGEGN